jgi:hypothetical protein
MTSFVAAPATHSVEDAARDQTLRRWRELHEQFSHERFRRMAELYATDFCFIDPLKRIDGDPRELERYLGKLEKLREIQFQLNDFASGADGTYVRWKLRFRAGRRPTTEVAAITHLRFAPDGRIELQRDYFDAASSFFELVPILGACLRWLRRRI